jgi:hypothetical protein
MAIEASVHSAAPSELSDLGDSDLVAEVGRRAARKRQATADLIRALIEFDRRRLYLGEGYSSLFAYCTSVLHYSEHGAFNRIEVARAAARWPQLLACLEDGSVHLAGARLLAPHLTAENIDLALAAARHKSKREIEDVAAGLARRAMLVAVAAEQYRLHLTISGSTRDKLRQVQALLSHQLPDGNPAVIFDRALEVLLEALERQRLGATQHPRPARARKPRARRVPAAVRARSLGARRGALCVYRQTGALQRTQVLGVPPRQALRQGRPADGEQHRAAVPGAQRVRGGGALRAAGHRRCPGATSGGEGGCGGGDRRHQY